MKAVPSLVEWKKDRIVHSVIIYALKCSKPIQNCFIFKIYPSPRKFGFAHIYYIITITIIVRHLSESPSGLCGADASQKSLGKV